MFFKEGHYLILKYYLLIELRNEKKKTDPFTIIIIRYENTGEKTTYVWKVDYDDDDQRHQSRSSHDDKTPYLLLYNV